MRNSLNRRGVSGSAGVALRVRRAAGAFGLGGALAAVAAAGGCSGGDAAGPPVFPVQGAVRFEGEPASGAFVVFHPQTPLRSGGAAPRASGLVQPDGRFELTTTSQSDGAPAGDYAVTVQWTRLIKQGGDVAAGPNVIPAAYASPETTPLRATVKDAPNRLEPFLIARARR